jgi:hypothetical protein
MIGIREQARSHESSIHESHKATLSSEAIEPFEAGSHTRAADQRSKVT